MRYLPNLMASLSGPLCIHRPHLDALLNVLRQKALGVQFTGLELHTAMNIAVPADRQQPAPPAQVAVIPILGAITNRAQSMGTSVEEISYMFDGALDSSADAIVFDVESPGGTVTGVPELADKIFAARGKKPMIAVSNGLMASAAYWLASQADEVVVSPSSETGSIGVFMMHEDWSKKLESEGIVVSEISAGKYKTEDHPFAPLSPEAKAFYEANVQEVYGWFTDAVGRGRGVSAHAVKSGYGEGRVLGAKAAVDSGLADRVATLDEVIADMQARRPVKKGTPAATLRGRAELADAAFRVS